MFTGIVETVGRVAEVVEREGSTRLRIASDLPMAELHTGESISVDGVCLTVVAQQDDCFESDVVPETLQRSTLGGVAQGRNVNLERAMKLGDRLDGHLVQGHVDETARVVAVVRQGGEYRLRIELVPQIQAFIAEKGSVALQGVSLTVASLGATSFDVALVPQTLRGTTLGELEVGDRVNVEVDLVARYLGRLLEAGGVPDLHRRGSRGE